MVRRPSIVFRRRRSQCSNIFYSETTGPIKARLYVKPPWIVGTKLFSWHLDRMPKMATTPIYGKIPSKILRMCVYIYIYIYIYIYSCLCIARRSSRSRRGFEHHHRQVKVHLYFSIILFFRCTRIRNDPWPEYLLELVYLQYNILFPSFGIHKIQVFLVYR